MFGEQVTNQDYAWPPGVGAGNQNQPQKQNAKTCTLKNPFKTYLTMECPKVSLSLLARTGHCTWKEQFRKMPISGGVNVVVLGTDVVIS